MDVRCERCQTEYELEDSSVSDEGTPVQCTACGNTFVVTSAPVVPLAAAPKTAPAPAEWLLETSEGPAHRFRNLTSLQKWIIERKVTRDDRISRTGHAWRRLGEIVELAPFFDVVDEADQARAAALTASDRPAQQSGPARAGTASEQSYLLGEPSTDIVQVRSRGVVRLVILVTVAATVAYAGISQVWHRGSAGGSGSAGQGSPVERAVDDQPVRASTWPGDPAPAMEIQKSPAGTAPAKPAAAAATITPEAAPGIRPQAAAPPVVAVAPASEVSPAAHAPSGEATAPSGEAPAPPGTGPPPNYGKLIAEADRLLGTGGTERARRLYEQALGLRPAGAAALAGLGYVALDVGHKKEALLYFKRSIAATASFGPAVFGLGEVYREQGRDQLALERYRRYVELDPSAVDVLAARRQIEILEARLASRAATRSAHPPP
jgi:predicted Zn finger-like uncharacterized protein